MGFPARTAINALEGRAKYQKGEKVKKKRLLCISRISLTQLSSPIERLEVERGHMSKLLLMEQPSWSSAPAEAITWTSKDCPDEVLGMSTCPDAPVEIMPLNVST